MKNIFYIALLLVSIYSYSQERDSIPIIKIDEIIVKATRLSEKVINIPTAITKLSFKNKQLKKQQLSFNEYLINIPGLFAQNANNFAQDLRVSIRGFGARAAFGIRGIKIIVDGVPETTPDGQGQIDNLNLSIIDEIEVIRGPSSTLYGNASGGVISITTKKNIEKNFIQAKSTLGAFNMQKYQLLSGKKLGKSDLTLLLSHTASDGFREHSAFESTNFNARLFHQFSKKVTLNINFNYANSPKAEDAGGLQLTDVELDREQARDRNVLYKAGEKINQLRFSANYKVIVNEHKELNAYAFYSTRNFYGKLPFNFGGVIDLKREYIGLGSSYQFNKHLSNATNKLQIGFEMAFQKDTRNRYRNLEGVQGDLVFNQIESFNSIAAYILDHFQVGKFNFNAGLRYDVNQLKAADKYLVNGDNSGNIKLNSVNPSIGVNYHFSKEQTVYTTFSTSFETPSLSELSANPSGQEGFNENLIPQKSKNFEIGYKAFYNNKLQIGCDLFYIDTENEIVPYEIAAFPGKKFFQNAGSSIRKGVELELAYQLSNYWKLNTSYTYSNFKFQNFVVTGNDFSNKQLPGIPKKMASLSLEYNNQKGFSFQINGIHNGSLYANNSNSVNVKEYTVINTNITYKIKTKKLTISPFLGINNAFNTQYYDNIRINAFGSRYYEAAPNRNLYGGVKIKI